MDFGDQLPCGGYEQEDKKIQNNLQKLSLQSQGIDLNKKSKCNKQCNSECKDCQCCSGCGCGCAKKQQEIKPKPKKNIECKKCKQNPAVLIHKNQEICKECLLKNIQYKTRLILENKLKVNAKSKLLVCFSGGLNSICLVQILSKIKKRYQKSPLFGTIQCIHIQQQSKLPQNYVAQFEKITQIKLNVINIEKILGQDKKFDDITLLFKSFKKNSNSVDLLTLFRNKLMLQYAQKNKFDYVLLAKNGQSLASQIFKYFAKGIGGNAPQLCSSQAGPFQYPLRQHLLKQLQYYFYNQRLSNLSMIAQDEDLSNVVYNQIDNYLDQFIVTLQDRYSHTAPAIVRTSEKLKNNFNEQKFCKWCWLKHDRPDNLCQKCIRLQQYTKDEEIKKLLPQWML